MKLPHRFTLLLAGLLIATLSLAQAQETQPEAKNDPTEVILLPTIHQNHLKSKDYSLARLETVMREIKPDFVCAEITPTALATNDEGKKDKRLSYFPEYTKVILPLRKELGYEVIPCSAYTQKVNFKTVGVKAMDEAHYALIAKALDEYQGQGKKILITFGSGHIDGLLEHLRLRKDIKIVDYRSELKKPQKALAPKK